MDASGANGASRPLRPQGEGCAAATGEQRSKVPLAAVDVEAAPAPKKPQKVRITVFDSVRFFLIAYIMVGHFAAYAGPSKLFFRMLTQINVVVGAFFALSGYVVAYTTTENARPEPSRKLLQTPKALWVLQRISGYYPLHILVLVLFSPVFVYADVFYNGWAVTAWHGFLSVTLCQAWFPMHAEVWNSPTWFLSALSFATAVLPFAIPELAKQSKRQLRRSLAMLFVIGLLPKLGYCYDHDYWRMLEGGLQRHHLHGFNLTSYNMQRFCPYFATIEVLMGAAACRLVMMDGADGEAQAPATNTWSTSLPVCGMVGIIILRAFGTVEISDMLTRACIFMPLFLRFLMSAHRTAVRGEASDAICRFLSSEPLVALGNYSFPLFVLHGPIGQVFYKKVIARYLFGDPLHIVLGHWFFFVYLAITFVAAVIVQKTFLSSKRVKAMASWSCDKLASLF